MACVDARLHEADDSDQEALLAAERGEAEIIHYFFDELYASWETR
mgnify:CR=1 FL=1